MEMILPRTSERPSARKPATRPAGIAGMRAERDREAARADGAEALMAILQSVVLATRALAAEQDFEAGIIGWLATLGAAADAARASFYEMPGAPGGSDQQMYALAEWSAADVQNSTPMSFRNPVLVPVDADAAWWQAVRIVAPYAAHVEELEGELKELLAVQGTATVLILPFQTASGIYAVSFDFLTHRDFDDRILAILQTAAGTIASEIERRDAQAREVAAEKERAELLSSVQQASSLLLGADRLADVAGKSLGIIAEALSCDLVAIGEFAPPGDGSELGWIDWRHFWLVADAPWPAPRRLKIDDQREAYACYSAGRLHLVCDLDRWGDPAASAIRNLGARSCFGVPITVSGQLWGKLTGASRLLRDWNAAEIETLRMFSAAIGAAIDRERLTLRRIEAERAVSTERARIAREIHDTLAQGFTGIILQGEAARARATLGPEVAAEHLRRAVDLAKFGLSEARRSVLALRPLVLEEKGLDAALAELAERVSVPGFIEVTYQSKGSPLRLSPQAEDALFRTAQEALTNAMRHSGAPDVAIALSVHRSGVTLEVADAGCGFDAGATQVGTGLRALTDRIERLEGQLRIVSVLGRGTRVRVRLPATNSGPP
jgi:signal transduction histidine kinase